MKRLLALALPIALAAVGVLAVVSAADAGDQPLLAEYPVPGRPLHVSVEAPGRIWFTLPDANWIGRLIVTSTVDYAVTTYTIPTANAQPYDLIYAAGFVWFTELQGNRIGRLDPGTGDVVEFEIPTPGSHPAGIDVLTGSPLTVWFSEREGNGLGRLVVTSTVDWSFDEFPLPSSYAGADPEDLYIQSSDSIWFTAPGANRIGNLKPSLWPDAEAFSLIYTGGGSQPWAIEVDSDGYAWFTERAGNRIGQFFPQTIANILWYTLPRSPNGPYDLDIASGWIWFTEADGNRVSRLHPRPEQIRQFGLPDQASPRGLAVDTEGCVWIALSGRNSIAAWSPPYFRYVFLPLVLRSDQ